MQTEYLCKWALLKSFSHKRCLEFIQFPPRLAWNLYICRYVSYVRSCYLEIVWLTIILKAFSLWSCPNVFKSQYNQIIMHPIGRLTYSSGPNGLRLIVENVIYIFMCCWFLKCRSLVIKLWLFFIILKFFKWKIIYCTKSLTFQWWMLKHLIIIEYELSNVVSY